MLLKDYLCRHDVPIQPRRVTRRCCTGALSRPRRVIMMLECSTGELLLMAAFMHHDDHGHDALMHYAAVKGQLTWCCVMCPGVCAGCGVCVCGIRMCAVAPHLVQARYDSCMATVRPARPASSGRSHRGAWMFYIFLFK